MRASPCFGVVTAQVLPQGASVSLSAAREGGGTVPVLARPRRCRQGVGAQQPAATKEQCACVFFTWVIKPFIQCLIKGHTTYYL